MRATSATTARVVSGGQKKNSDRGTHTTEAKHTEAEKKLWEIFLQVEVVQTVLSADRGQLESLPRPRSRRVLFVWTMQQADEGESDLMCCVWSLWPSKQRRCWTRDFAEFRQLRCCLYIGANIEHITG